MTMPSDVPLTIVCGVTSLPSDIEKVYAQRFRVYTAYKYIDPAKFPANAEHDAFDAHSTYVVAKRGERVIGSLRLIHGTSLPIHKYFDFTEPASFSQIPTVERAELSRLVVERLQPVDVDIPRNIIMLMLVKVVTDEARQRGLRIGYAYLKASLIRKLRLLRFPYQLIDSYACTYPETGFMHPYFSDAGDSVTPGYFFLDEVENYLDYFFVQQHLLERTDDRSYALKHDAFNGVLKMLGIL